ncbi:MAG TPA: alpha/beta fold hydrolase [Ktedonobacteraceae bacterium]|nr:alpha/beta fold hydrolase [Ktedonobacteraceae bacterium]
MPFQKEIQQYDIRFRSDGKELAGTLTLPDAGGPFPAVLLLTGSGRIDRDENGKKLRLNVFSELAHALAQQGIASLRYDKRGVGQSEGDYWTTGFEDHVQDAQAALQFLKQQKPLQAENIFLLGHSEGAFLSTRLAGNGAGIAGVILLAGAAQSGEAILKWQAGEIVKGLKGVNGWLIRTFHINVSKAQQRQIEKIKRSQKDWFRQQLLVKINAKWFREFMAYDPAEDLSCITVPVLAITGSKDIQVDPADLERMAHLLQAPFESHLIEGMTHVLRIEEGDASLSSYKEEVKHPIEPRLGAIILQWLENRIDQRNEARM